MPSWSEFLLPHPDPHARTMRTPLSSPSANSHSHPHSPRHPPPNVHPSSPYIQPSPHTGIRHHLSAQGYLQPPPRSRYRPPPPGTASGSSSAQSSVQDLLALRLVVSASGHETSQKRRARADSAVISSASCTSFSCASARGRSSWQAVAEAFGAREKEREVQSQKGDRKGKRKEKGKGKERSPPPRIGTLAFEVEEDEEGGQISELEEEMDWENVTMEEAAGSDVYDEGWRHDWGTRKIGLAISRSLLRSRSGDNLDRHNRYWSGRGGGGGSEDGTSSMRVGVGRGRGGGTETPRATPHRLDLSDSKGKRVAFSPDENVDAVDLIHHGSRSGRIDQYDALNGQNTPAVGLAKSNTLKPPVISINGVELVCGVAGSPSSKGRSSSKYGRVSSSTPGCPSPSLPTFLASDVPTPSGLTSASLRSSPPTSSSPALNAPEVSPANINKRKRRHRSDRACIVDDDIGLHCSVRSAAVFSSSSSSSSAGCSGRSRSTEDDPIVLEEGRRECEARGDRHTHGDTHAYVNGTVTSMHERGGKFKREVPGDRIIDNNVGVGVEDAAVDDGDIDSVIACDPLPLRELSHNHHHHPHILQQDEDSENTPVARSQPLPLTCSSSPSPPQSSPPDSPLDSAPTPRPLSPSCTQPTLSSNNSSVQSSPSLPSFIHGNSSHADVDSDMALLNLGIAMARTPSISAPDAWSHTAPSGVAQDAASTSAISVASKTSSTASKRSKPAKKSSKRESSGPLDASSSATSSRSDVAADSQLLPPTTRLPPTLGAPVVVSPLEFDPATYFDSVSSASASAALSPNAGLTNSSSSTTAPTMPAKLMQMDSEACSPCETVVEHDDGSDSDSEDGSHVGMEAQIPVDVEPSISPSILSSVPMPTTLEICKEPTLVTKLSTPTLSSFVPVAPLSISKKNPQGNHLRQKQKPASGSSSSVASLFARRFSFRSKSGGNLRGSYLQTSSPVASRPSSPSPLRNESFEGKVEEVVFMLENLLPSSGTSGSVSARAENSKKGSEVSTVPLPISAHSLESNSTSESPPNPVLSPSPSTAPSAWTAQQLDPSRSPSNLLPSSASSADTLFEFGTGMATSSSRTSYSGSQVSTPGTSPGPQLSAIAGPLSESLAKRWRRWSLTIWEHEGQNVKGQQQDVGSNSNFGGSGMPGANANTRTGTSQKQIQEQKLFGRSTSGEGGVVGGAGGASKAGNAENAEATRDGLAEALSVLGGGTDVGDEGVRASSVSTSINASSTTTTMSSSVSLSSPTAGVPAAPSRKLIKPRPNLRSASVDDQNHHDLQRIFSTEDVSAATPASSSHLRTKKAKFTLGGHAHTSDNPESPKTASFSVHPTTDDRPISARGNAIGSSIPVNNTAANSLARRDTFRPPLIRRDAVAAPEQATRRWTLASAITDEAISDEGLLKELERIRVLSEWDRRRARAAARENAKGNSVDRRMRAMSLDAAEVVTDADGQSMEGATWEGGEEQADQEDEEEEMQLWEIDVGAEIWEGREGMLARERERELERARVVEGQRFDRENERADADAASVSTGSSGHSSSSTSEEDCMDTTPETTPALSPFAMSPGFTATASPANSRRAAKSVLSDSTANKTKLATSLVAQPASTWLAAQRALLICRELILTERRYFGLMRLLLDTHYPTAGYAAHHLSHPHSGMRTSASASDIQSLQQHYQGIEQQLQYQPPAATTTYSSLPPASSSSSPLQTHILVGPAPPARMLAATIPLADATMRFLRAMECAPSVGGVAKAFVDHEAEMEEVYVAWCREVGAWFVDGPTDMAGSGSGGGSSQASQETSRIPSPPGSTDGHTSHGHEDGSSGPSTIRLVPIPPPTPPLPGMPPYAGVVSANTPATSSSPISPLKRVAGSWRRSMTSIPSLVGGNNSSGSIYGANIHASASERTREKERERRKDKDPLMTATASGESAAALAAAPVILGGGHALSPSGGASAHGELSGSGSRVASSGSNLNAGASSGMHVPPAKPLRKLGVRDLAILPTQRVMRYVLLYRDLLAHTPATASSRVLVERALAVATRIADNCDRAQGHSAFIAPNTASSPPASSTSNPNTTSSYKTPTSLLPTGSLSGSGTGSSAGASRSGSGTSSSSNTSGNGWRRKVKARSRTASLTASPVPTLGAMTPVRSSILQKT